MGLDLVELAMEVEETFGIELPDAEAEKLVTPALLVEFVLSKVQTAEQSVCLSRKAFYRLRRSFMNEFGCRRNQVKPDTPLELTVPRPGRRAAWRRMKGFLHANDWPKLRRPGWVEVSIVVVFAMAAVGFGFTGFSFWAAPGAAIVPSGLAVAVTRPLCTEFPKSCGTVGQLAHFLVGHAPKLFEPAGRVWSRSEVAETIRRITIELLGLQPEQYREDAGFVEDLGAG